jgi:aspartate/methionine/tyrosine aminotransferase
MENFIANRRKFVANPIAEVHNLANTLSKSGKKVFRLDTGDPAVYFKTPEYMLNAYKEALSAGNTNYSKSEGSEELKSAVARRYRRLYGMSISNDDVIITAGLSEAFLFLNNALINRNDAAILFRPYYPPYYTYLKLCEGSEIAGRYDESEGWQIDIDNLKATIRKNTKRIKYMLVTNPNNPTGTVLNKNALRELVDIANDNGIFLVSDEIYDEITFGDAKFTSIGELAKGMPHMIWNGASKNFDATGFRIGFMIIPEADRRSASLKSALSDFALARLSVNTPAEHAVAVGINDTAAHNRAIKFMVKEIADRVKHATKLVNESPYMEAVDPNGAFYIFPRIDLKALHFKTDNDFVLDLLKSKLVQTRSGSAFGSPGHFRIVSLAPKEILDYAINKINAFCKERAAKR